MEANAVSSERPLVTLTTGTNERPSLQQRVCTDFELFMVCYSDTFNNCSVISSDANLTIFAYFYDFIGAIFGFSFIFIGVILFSLSSVLVKSVPIDLHPLSTTVGSLIISLPVYLVAWLVLDGQLNTEQWQPRAVWAVIYMGVFASLLGFLAYFFILQKLEASTVALVTMMTPVVSMTLGILLNDERFSYSLLVGGLMIMTGLGVFQFGNRLLLKIKRV